MCFCSRRRVIPFTQINDMHLNAWLARLLMQLENEWVFDERQRLVEIGKNIKSNMTREEILSTVHTTRLSFDHARAAEKGYKRRNITAVERPSGSRSCLCRFIAADEET